MFLNNICQSYELAFPFRHVNCNNPKSRKVRWFTEDLAKLRETVQFIHEAYRLYNTLELRNLLCKYRKKYNILVKNTRRKAYDKYVSSNKNNPKAMWQLIKVGKTNNTNADIKVTAGDFNDYFVSIANNTVKSLPTSLIDPIKIMSKAETHCNTCTHYFKFKEVSYNDVRDAVESLKNSNSKDIYGLTSVLIKVIKNFIIVPLTHLFNESILSGKYPNCLKLSLVVPIFKKGDNGNPDNYRPISLVPIFSKIFEKLLMNQIVIYLNEHKILTEVQFGFRKGRSTQDALLSLIDKIIKAFENGEFYTASFLDLKKAFDCVSHEVLIRKLYFYNFSPSSVRLISSYLTERNQQTVFNNELSEPKTVKHGVPQGSILGPLLFLLYINDLPSWTKETDVVLYADDTTAGGADKCLSKVKETSTKNLKNINQWFIANKLSLNYDKTVNIVFSLRHYNEANLSLNKTETKFLGVTIDNKLLWDKQGNCLAKVLCRNTFLLRNLANFCSTAVLKSAYFAYVHSQISYGILIWGHASIRHRIFQLQRRAVRLVANLGYKDDCRECFSSLKILTFPSIFIFKSIEYLLNNIDLYPTVKSFHTYDTRNSDLCIGAKRLSRTRVATNYHCIKLYNALSIDYQSFPITKLLSCLKKYLLEKAFYSIQEYLDNNFDDFYIMLNK